MSQYPQDPNQPRFDVAGFPIKPKKKHTLRTVLIVVGAVVGLLLVIGLLSPSEPASGPVQNSPAATTPIDGPTPQDPIVTPTNKPTTAPKTTAPKPKAAQPSLTKSQEQAIGSAKSYLEFSAFSRKGLIRQLSSSAGEGFSVADATYAVDHITVNWNEQAARSAKSYLEMTHFSRQGLIHQLESSAGEGFTHAQAVYGVTKAGL